MNRNRKIVLITGASSGIGLETARALASSGCRVYDLSRHAGPAVRGMVHIDTDVTDPQQCSDAVRRVIEAEQRIDILISNAGFGISGASEFTRPEDARRQMDVNFFGAFHISKAVVPFMRKRRSGRILFISSVAAPIPIPFQAFYSASKAAIRAYGRALASEVRPFGIRVCVILPGDIRTGFTAAREKSAAGEDVYGGRISRSVAVMEQDETTGIRADRAGKLIAGRALGLHLPAEYTIGAKYKLFVFLTRLLPAGLLDRIVGKIYAS